MATATKSKCDIAKINEAVKEYSLTKILTLEKFEQGLQMAKGVKALQGMVHDYIDDIMPLMDGPIGFFTDRAKSNKGSYSPEIVRDCLIDALLRGLRIVDNEFGIIAGKMYPAKNGYKRLCKELDGVTNIRFRPEIPTVHRDKSGNIVGSVSKGEYSYFYRGNERVEQFEYGIKADNYSSADQIIGKAERRVYRDIYNQVTGSAQLEDQDDWIPTTGQTQASSGMAALGQSITQPGVTEEQHSRIWELIEQLDGNETLYEDACEKVDVVPGSASYEDAAKVIQELESRLPKGS